MREFVWVDGERTIHFGPAADAVEQLGGPGYTLLTTPRAAAAAPWIADGRGRRARSRAAARSTSSRAGCSARCAATGSSRWAAGAWSTWRRRSPRRREPGTGRRADRRRRRTTAAGRDVRAMAVPTTLSGAELTSGHRHAVGVPEATPRVRAAVVVFDPALAASQPVSRARRELGQRARPRRRRAVHGQGQPRRDARRPRGRAADRRGLGGRRARPRDARARRAAGGLRDRLDRPRPAPRARPDARARARGGARPGERGGAAAHDRGARTPPPGARSPRSTTPCARRRRPTTRPAGRRGRQRDADTGAGAEALVALARRLGALAGAREPARDRRRPRAACPRPPTPPRRARSSRTRRRPPTATRSLAIYEAAARHRTMLSTKPPSTRSAPPVVADARSDAR